MEKNSEKLLMSIYYNTSIKFLLFLILLSCTHQKMKEIKISNNYDNRLTQSVYHDGKAPYGSYLTLDLEYAAYKQIYEQIKKDYPKLKNRGEAHITIITPIEYHQVLEKFISIEEIFQISEKERMQKFPFKIICLARSQKVINNQIESTFYLVIQSEKIINLREKIARTFKARGGEGFEAHHYFPHITIGFTKRDLHESDGVLKDSQACIQKISFN